MKTILETIVSFMSFHNMLLKDLNVKADSKGRLESCSGSIFKGNIQSHKYRKLIEKEWRDGFASHNYKYKGSELKLSETEFSITGNIIPDFMSATDALIGLNEN